MRNTLAAEPTVSLTFNRAPVSEVLQALAEQHGANLVIAPGVEGSLTMSLQHVPWSQAWHLVSRMAGISSEKQGNVLLVFPRQQLPQAAQTDVAVATSSDLPLKNRLIRLKYADAGALFSRLQKEKGVLMSPRGEMTLDIMTNSLLLRDSAPALRNIAQWIAALDVPLQQVELVAHIVTINKEKLQQLGVRWGLAGADPIEQALRASQFHVNLPVADPAISAGFTLAHIDGRLLSLELSALERENQVEIIASPHLFTSHQQPASIKQGTEIPYEVSSGNNGKTSMEFREAVLGMEVTPAILANSRILLKLHITQNVPGKTVKNGDGEVVTIDKQEIDTQVTVRDGQTLALGGIFQQQRDSGKTQVPLLGNLPLLGRLFRHQMSQQKRRELVIFITPHLMHEQ
ncbi:DNA transporter HofQ [Erwinia sp. OLTSP20]|nr:DNA transporter HofQ [Erwinia sp. OLSSP12]PIJ84002.1 DNA transporter HofQ [Erwinia sp. OLCASP19]PIJ86533.1 DNA transporter HofQ [Erwinia sp. OLMTSP26]PIJ88012.1 DNA transporter HofQ [Erwinia sp. OLMDSP33]PIJ90630.1 DNA transporter HofQ [Erwinia sp. OLFS4]PIJ93629.1 DNA transporter HofQ [Erwinia sp. OLTSP20]